MLIVGIYSRASLHGALSSDRSAPVSFNHVYMHRTDGAVRVGRAWLHHSNPSLLNVGGAGDQANCVQSMKMAKSAFDF